MKISEITDKNLTWSTINNVNISYVKETYAFLLKSLPLIIKLQSPSRSKVILNNVNNFVSTVDAILKIQFPDVNDTDILQMTAELVKMKTHILSISSRLKT